MLVNRNQRNANNLNLEIWIAAKLRIVDNTLCKTMVEITYYLTSK